MDDPAGGAADELAEAAAATYITPSLLSQAIVFEFLRRGSFEPNLTELRAAAQAPPRRDARRARAHCSGARCASPRPTGASSSGSSCPLGTGVGEVLERAKGVTAVAGAAFSATSSSLRLAYSYASPDEIEVGVERLAAAM